MTVPAQRRFSRSNPCRICGGYPELAPGQQRRCIGYLSMDGSWAYCSREQYAQGAPWSDGANAYRHALVGRCRCGREHGMRDARSPLIVERTPLTIVASVPKTLSIQPPTLDPDLLHEVYSTYLSLLSLRPVHVDAYKARGAVDLEVAREHGYVSLPYGYLEARRVIDTLVDRFGIETVRRVPGFYQTDNGRLLTHTARAGADGAVIVCRDELGRINLLVQHYILRSTNEKLAKYMYFKGGNGDGYTIAGPYQPETASDLGIIEGIHKAHVAARLFDGLVVMGVMGARLSDGHLATIERMGPGAVIEMFDADKFENNNVAAGRATVHQKLLGSERLASVEIATAVWETADGKGLDDLGYIGGLPRTRILARRPAVTARRPVEIAQPGSVPAGCRLTEVQAGTQKMIRQTIRQWPSKRGRVQVVAGPPGVGKSTAAFEEIERLDVRARIVVATTAKADEVARRHPTILRVEGRNDRNCANYAIVKAAQDKHYEIGSLVCRQCPERPSCQVSGYYSQFGRPGALIGTTQMLYSSPFLAPADLVVLDDPDLGRVMIDTRSISSALALQLAAAVPPGPLRDLLVILQRAIDSLVPPQDDQNGKGRRGFVPPLVGPAAWDVLARAAGTAGALIALIGAVPGASDILPEPASGRALTVEEVQKAPDAVLGKLIQLLKDEVGDFERGRNFNSGLSIHPGGIEVRSLRPMPSDSKTGRPMLRSKAVLILDATPILPLYECLAAGLVFEAVFAPSVELPPNVIVTQIADRFYGKTSIQRGGEDALLASLAKQRRRFSNDREAVVCPKSLRDAVIAMGVPEDRVLTFGGSRGLNTIEDTEVLHFLGRPQAPDYVALQIANAVYRGEEPISPHLAMRPVSYAGYRAPDGTGRAITVLDFQDKRVSDIFRAGREDEMVQAIHRARLYRVGSPQADFFADTPATRLDPGAERKQVRVVIHTAHPIPGLRIDELIYSDEEALNERRAREADERILAARDYLIGTAGRYTISAVAKLTGSNKQTVARALDTKKFRGPRFTHLLGVWVTGRRVAGMEGARAERRSNVPRAMWKAGVSPEGRSERLERVGDVDLEAMNGWPGDQEANGARRAAGSGQTRSSLPRL